ncbi:GntR family transcriptional regulator [Lacticaseibacillus camelliae]|uniref:HTH gntR-type domain-containing protein n=1 Tax=Lacticaseibacillus camelliae DSM 22697 = JCM 13995 TaxID=1423730 RepID=A0A0R2FBW4_9LACO|nr:GntR family transcriptional regulator [Lacticaseibacillus camelliae]KRN25896.1 hypothetical protein FC75_GL002029 [Lacticaseibacillus camelliae DSM 22697 = JCM 13995]
MSYQPKYIQIYRRLKANIATGTTQTLPSEKELTEVYSVSRVTIRKALALLREEHLIESGSGMRTRILARPATSEAGTGARTLAGGKQIAFVLSGFADSYGAQLIRTFQAQVAARGFIPIIRLSNESQHDEAVIVKSLIAEGVSGLVIMPVEGESENKGLLAADFIETPVVIIDRRIGDYPLPFVGTDNFKISRTITRMLLDMGHRNILFLVHRGARNTAIQDRIRGIQTAYREIDRRVSAEAWLSVETNFDSHDQNTEMLSRESQKINRRLNSSRPFTCVMALDFSSANLFSIALSAADQPVSRLGGIAFDGLPYQTSRLNFNRIQQDETHIMTKALDLLDDQMNNPPLPAHEVLVDALYIDNHSIQPLN